MIVNQVKTKATHIRSILNQKRIHFMNLPKGASIQYEIELVNSGRVKLDNIFGIHKPYAVVEELQSLLIYWGDGAVTRVYEETIKTGSMTDGVTIEHMYDLPMGTSITVTIVSDSETYVPVSYSGDLNAIKVKKVYGTINAFDEIKPLHEILQLHLEEILSIKNETGESLFSRVNPGITSLENLFSGFRNLRTIHFDIFNHDLFKNVVNVNSMLKSTGDLVLPNTMFEHMPNITMANSLFEGSNISEIHYDIFENQSKLTSVSKIFKNCSNLKEIPDNFLHWNSITDMTEAFYGVQISNLLTKSLVNKTYNGCRVSGLFAENSGLIIPEDTLSRFSNISDFSSIFNNSNMDIFNTNLINTDITINNGFSMFGSDIILPDSNTPLDDEKFIITTGLLGGIANVERLLANRNVEILKKPFKFISNVTEVKYNDCFLECISLFSDRQIFGDFYNSTYNSGLKQIMANCDYTISTFQNLSEVKLLSAYNNVTQFEPSLDSIMLIEWGDGAVTTLRHSDLISLNLTDGIVKHVFKNMGTYNINVRYAHCAVMTPIEYNHDIDSYKIESSTIELFPTETSYVGLHGTELFHAKKVNGDFFKLFKYNPIYETLDTHTWIEGIFRVFNSTVEEVSKDIFQSSKYLGKITDLKHLFRYNSDDMVGRSNKFLNIVGDGINPFKAISGGHFKYFDEVTLIERWFNDSIDGKLVNISHADISDLVSFLPMLEVVDHFLHSCEFSSYDPSRYINWSSRSKINTVISYIGRIDKLCLDMLSLPKLKKINRLHVYPILTGLKASYFDDFQFNFTEVEGDVDITEVFLGENFEIPDMFITNVSGKLLYNNCFKGSYRFNEDESLIFTNVNEMSIGHVTGLVTMNITEPLTLGLDYKLKPTSVKLEMSLKGKDPNPGVKFSVICRLIKKLKVYGYDEETDNEEIVVIREPLAHLVIENASGTFNIENLTDMYYESDELEDLYLEIYCISAVVVVNSITGTTIENMRGVFGHRYWRETFKLTDSYPGLIPSKIICTDEGGPFRNILPINNMVNFSGLFIETTDTNLIDYRILKTQASSGDTLNLTECFLNSSIGEFDVRMFEFVGDVSINGTRMFQSNSNPLFKFINLDSGPYIFMELLFTKFKDASSMFRWAATPDNIFNGARYWGCGRNGGIITVDDQKLTNIKSFMSLYQDELNYPNNLMNDYWPEWNKNQIYILEDIAMMCNGRRVKVNPEYDYGYLPNTVNRLYANSAFRPVMNKQKLTLDIFKLNKSYNLNYIFTTYDFPSIQILRDKHWIESDFSEGEIHAWNMFNSGRVSMDDSAFKFLIEPFKYSLNQMNFRESFIYFTTYAPDEVLFRNINYTGDSGATKLEYPNFIEYKNITLTGTTLTLTREELLPEHSFTTYVTISVDYGSGYETPEWLIIDKGINSIDLELSPERIVNSNVSIKIQSTQCFYLDKTNVDRVQLLTGSYRKDLQPGDSEFFNFKADYMWFIEEFGADLFKDVKIKQDTDNFRFVRKGSSMSYLKIIHGDIFRTQKHLTSISYLFMSCLHYNPSQSILNGLDNVIEAHHTFQKTAITDTSLILSYVPKLKVSHHGFRYSASLKKIHPNTYKFNPELLSIEGSFSDLTLDPEPISKEFFNNISSTCYNIRSLFQNTTGLSLESGTGILDGSFNFTNGTINTAEMFSGADLRDVRVSFIHSGSLDSTKSTNMFLGCTTYEDRTLFESRYGNNTGITFMNSISYGFESTSTMDGYLDLIDDVEVDIEDERFKLVLNGVTWYKNIKWAIENSITGLGTNFTIFSNRTLIPRSSNVKKINGIFPSNKIVNNSSSQIGKKYPLIEYIDPNMFSNLVDQENLDNFFENLRDINVFPTTLLNPCVNLTTVQYIFKNSGGFLSEYRSAIFDNKPKLHFLRNAFENVQVGMVLEGSIKNKKPTVHVTYSGMFMNSNAYVSKNVFDIAGSEIYCGGTFTGCKSVFTADELINTTTHETSPKNACNVETVESFIPTITTTNTLVNIFPLHDAVETGRKVDVLVDWGDGTDQIYRNINAETIGTIIKTYASNGTRTPRLWCNYYGIGIKHSHELKSTITSHAGGYFGENIRSGNQLRFFFYSYFPECLTIDSTLFNYVIERNFVYVFKDSKVNSSPSKLFKSNRTDVNPVYLSSAFENTAVETLDPETFKDITMATSQNDLDFSFLFGGSQSLNNMPPTLFNELVTKSTKITNISNMFRNTAVANKVIPAELLKDIDFSNLHGVIDRVFQGCNLVTFDKTMFKNVSNKLISLDGMFLNAEELVITEDFPIDKNWLVSSGTVVLSNAFKRVTPQRIDYRVVEKKNGVTLNILESLQNVKSIYTEAEMFDYNQTINSSGLITDPRTIQKLTTTSGNLCLKPFVNTTYDKQVLIKVNGTVRTLQPAPGSLTISVNDNDTVEIITFDNIRDIFYGIDTALSTAKVKKLDGILNIGSNSCSNGVFKHTILELFGPDIEEISNTFFTNFNIVTGVPNLCKGLVHLKVITAGMLDHFRLVTDWTSMFENCDSLALSGINSNMFSVANSGVTFDYMFKNDISITTIPPSFFKGCNQINKTFTGTFMNCYGITSIPNDIDEF